MSFRKALIWDWNGTILDDVQPCIELMNVLLKDRSLPLIDLNFYKDNFGFPVINFYELIGFDFEKEPFPDLANAFISSYNNAVKSFPLHKNAKSMLQQLADENVEQFILSAAHQDTLNEMVSFHGLDDVFKEVSGLDNNFAASKVDNARKLMETHKLDLDHTWFIGDTLHDLEVAKIIKVNCALIANGHQSKLKLKEAGAPVVLLNGLHQVPGLFLR